MARRDSARLTSSHQVHRRLVELAALVALAFAPMSSRAAQLSEVRVGTHSDHTRIVLQLDSAADYRMLSSGQDGELVLALDARSSARKVPSKSPLVRGVRVEPSATGSTVRVALAHPDVQVTEMILSNPPRIVFDLARGAAPAVEAVAPPASSAAAPPPEAVAAKPAEAPNAVVAAEARPVDAADARPAREPVGDPVAVATPDAMGASQPTEKPNGSPLTASAPSADAGRPGAPATMPPASPPSPGAASEPAATPPSSAASPTRRPAPAPGGSSESASSRILGTLMSPTGLVVVGAVLLAGVALVAMRRRAAGDDDPLYSVMSAEDAAGEDEAAGMPSAARWDEREEAAPARALESEQDDSYEELPLARRGSAATQVGSAARSNGSIFDADSPNGSLAGGPANAGSTLAAGLGAGSRPETLRVASDVENRIAELERRLDQLGEARERLERQVAAQTEELRVQRAAIARTQRVVRSMTKSEELATEPVPRAPNA